MFNVQPDPGSHGPGFQQSLIDEVEAEVNRRIDAGESFTAFDISRAVQAAGVRERHRNLKVIVHDMFERGDMPGYTRTQITLPGGEQPLLYHPDNTAPAGNRFAVASNAPSRAAGIARHIATMFGQRSAGPTPRTGSPDGANRLRLPLSVLRTAGFLPGDTVHIARDRKTRSLTISARPANAPDTRPTRAHRLGNGNLRLTVDAAIAGISLRITVVAPGRIEVTPLS
ncbi:MAG: hypothetical protein SFU56_11740 [Capsulimonadales bacterium]|nr:hypothetical protein [Capsulimonadales bacterium]